MRPMRRKRPPGEGTRGEIRAVIAACDCCRLGLCDHGRAYIVPLDFGFAEREGRYTFYFHSAKEGRKISLIRESGWEKFPPRLPEQPIFYPVLNERYAEEISSRWNTKDPASGFKGYVTRFEVDDGFLSRYEVQTVGRSYHQEYWVPAGDLMEFKPTYCWKN